MLGTKRQTPASFESPLEKGSKKSKTCSVPRDEAVQFEINYSQIKATRRHEENSDFSRYTVEPSEEWQSMKKYPKCIIRGIPYLSGNHVYVKAVGTDPRDRVAQDFWVARILQIRAANPKHVYALVSWLYWPKELPPNSIPISGCETHHGKRELISSNYMDVLDVLSFAGKAEVTQWLKKDDKAPRQNLYWRQTFDRDTHQLSDVAKNCVCGGHYNPDKTMIGCQNCTIQLHPECLVDDVLTKTYNRLAKGQIKDQVNNSAANVKATKHQVKIARKQKRQSARPYYGKFEAVIKDEEKSPYIEITDLRLVEGQRVTWQENIYCPKCNAKLK